VSSAELADMLWEDGAQPASAHVTMQNYVKRLRQALGDAGHDIIATRPGGYMINVQAGELDVSVFEGLLMRARESARAARWDRAALELRDALARWRGRPLADIPCDQLVRDHAPRLAEMRLQAVLGELAHSHLLTEHVVGRFAMHDLLRVYSIEQADAHETAGRHAAIGRVLDHYLHTAYAMSQVLDPSRVPLGLAPPQPGVQPEEVTEYRQAWDWAEAERRVLLAAIAGAAGLGFGRHAWQIASSLETYLLRRGHWHDLADTQHSALAAARRAGDTAGQAYAQCSLGRACTLLGAQDDASAHLSSALELFQALDDPAGEALARIRMCTLSWRQSRYDEAFVQAQRALGLFRASGHRAGEAGALNNIGWFHFRLGDHERGFGRCQEALAIFRAIGDRRGEANVLDSLGFGHQRLGAHAEAIASFGAALRVFRELGDRYNQAEILTHLAASHQESGNAQAAAQCWEQSLAILTELNHPDAAEVLARLRRLDTANAS